MKKESAYCTAKNIEKKEGNLGLSPGCTID